MRVLEGFSGLPAVHAAQEDFCPCSAPWNIYLLILLTNAPSSTPDTQVSTAKHQPEINVSPKHPHDN